MATQDVHAPTLGAHGEPCASCGAALAADQRYCLQCGARRAEARLAFREILAAAPPPPGGAALPAPLTGQPLPQRGGLAFLAGLLCLLVALGVGILIGRSGDDTPTAAAPAPAQVITVGGGSTPAATTTPTTTTPAASSDTTGTTGSSSSKSAKDGSAATSTKDSKATNKSVKKLDSASGSDYQKKSQKLPKQVGTGGKPPPKDNKPAGGGSGFESIG
jgi:hypothetical protein